MTMFQFSFPVFLSVTSVRRFISINIHRKHQKDINMLTPYSMVGNQVLVFYKGAARYCQQIIVIPCICWCPHFVAA